MTMEELMQGLAYLKTYYPESKIDISDPMTAQIWLERYGGLSKDDWMKLLKEYTNRSEYPPRNPLEICKYREKWIRDSLPKAEEMFWRIIHTYRRNAFYSNREKLRDSIKAWYGEPTYTAYMVIRPRLEEDIHDNIREDFIEAYNDNLALKARNEVLRALQASSLPCPTNYPQELKSSREKPKNEAKKIKPKVIAIDVPKMKKVEDVIGRTENENDAVDNEAD